VKLENTSAHHISQHSSPMFKIMCRWNNFGWSSWISV
jgi:hypothetical protein